MRKRKNLPLLRNLVYSLVLFEKIKTTRARAKAIQGIVDRLVNKIKKGTVAAKRDVLSFLPQKEIVKKLTKEIVPQLNSRLSGYTRIVKIGERAGDAAPMVVIEWVKVSSPVKASEGKNDKANKPK